MPRFLRRTVSGLLLISALLACLIFSVTWRPDAREVLAFTCPITAPVLVPGQALKVMTWNIQYLAGKRYVFWYNLADGSGPDTRPTLEDMAFSLDEVARVIRDERPDLVLLQEVDDNAKASAYQNQLALLQERLVDLYPCSTQAFTWKADFVPDWHIFGSVGRSLSPSAASRSNTPSACNCPWPRPTSSAASSSPGLHCWSTTCHSMMAGNWQRSTPSWMRPPPTTAT